MGVNARRAALGLAAILAVAFAAAVAVAPALAGREFDRALRDAHPAHGAPHYARGRLALEDLSLRNDTGALLASARSVRVAPAWPLRVEIDGLSITTAGLAAFDSLRWEDARTFTKRQYGNFHRSRPEIAFRDMHLALGGSAGDLSLANARGQVAFADTEHAALEIDGVALRLESTQDAATLDLVIAGTVRRTTRVPAPGWAGF